jgi:hypothetical protein
VKTFEQWSEAFVIFAKYDHEDNGNMSVDGDILYVGNDPETYSAEDRQRLTELGWYISEHYSSFYHLL